MKNPNGPSRIQAALLILVCVVSGALIVFLKTESDRRSPAYADVYPEAAEAKRLRSMAQNVAVPDTTVAPEILPAVTDTPRVKVKPVEITIDPRPAETAGHDDGYLAGLDDGAADTPHAAYNDDNNFPTRVEQRAYKKGYAEGYAAGFNDGKEGKHLVPAPEDELEGTTPDDEAPTIEARPVTIIIPSEQQQHASSSNPANPRAPQNKQ